MDFSDLLGLPFADGGRGPSEYDCWGLVMEVYRRYGVSLPDYPISAMDAVQIGRQMAREASRWVRIDPPVQHCIIVLRLSCGSWANHAGVYLGEGRFIHAYRASGVVIDRVKWWQSRVAGFYVPREVTA